MNLETNTPKMPQVNWFTKCPKRNETMWYSDNRHVCIFSSRRRLFRIQIHNTNMVIRFRVSIDCKNKQWHFLRCALLTKSMCLATVCANIFGRYACFLPNCWTKWSPIGFIGKCAACACYTVWLMMRNRDLPRSDFDLVQRTRLIWLHFQQCDI